MPLLWKAAQQQSVAVIEYLASPSAKVLEAYRHYASNNNTKLAKRIREATASSDALPQLLGFNLNSCGESAVLAAAASWNGKQHLATMKKLMAVLPKYTSAGIASQASTHHFTPLMAVCATGGTPETFDWLVSNGGDINVRDRRG